MRKVIIMINFRKLHIGNDMVVMTMGKHKCGRDTVQKTTIDKSRF